MPRVFDVMEARSATVTRGLFGEPEFSVTLITEMGGANSHGAVVARETGIPAVDGISGTVTSA